MAWFNRSWPTSWKGTLPLVGIALEASDNVILVMEVVRPGIDGLVIAGASSAAALAFGTEGEGLLGRDFATLIAAEADPETLAALRYALLRREKLRGELQCVALDGSPLTLGLHLIPVDDPATGRPHAVIIGRDITQRHDRKRLADEMADLVAAAFPHVHAAVAIADAAGTLRMANPRLHGLLGYDPGELVGGPGLRVLPAEDRAAVAARLADLTEGNHVSLPVRLSRKDGSVLDGQLYSVAIASRDGQRFRITTLAERGGAPAALPQVAVVGKIQMIGLEEVKAALGPRWPLLEQRVMATAEHVLRRRLQPADTLVRTADSAFMIAFADATPEEAALRATAIGHEIRTRLIGESETAAVAQVTAVTAVVDNRGEAAAMPPHDTDPAPAAAPVAAMETLERRLAAQQHALQRQAREAIQAVAARGVAVATPVTRADGQPVALSWVDLGQRDRQQLGAARSVLAPAEAAAFDLDLFLLAAALDVLTQAVLAGVSHPLLLPLEAGTIAAPRRFEAFLARLGTLDPALRRCLIPMVRLPPPREAGAPGAASAASLGGTPNGDRLRLLRAQVRGIGYLLDEPAPPPAELLAAPGTILALGAASLAVPGGLDLPRLRALLAATRPRRAMLLVRDVAGPEQQAALQAAGVDLIAGRPA